MCLFAWMQVAERERPVSWTWGSRPLWPPEVYLLELSLGSLWKQQEFLTEEPSLHPQLGFF